ncbi:DUF1385 domain-containing protein [Halonatronum saccharophilum]|uniref:DUF1385 domain-containing protein n=1 Tax=Halonatronum saccharophilum TaxID=150060 RepID=UPI000483AE81|nr:DUF1385 domain-containing protein [Halonatronum saccharophilum]
MKIGGRAYKNGVRLFGEKYSVKAYYDGDKLKYQVGKSLKRKSRWFLFAKKIPVLRGLISLFSSIIFLFKEASNSPKKFWPIISILVVGTLIEIYFIFHPSSGWLISKLNFGPYFYITLFGVIAYTLRRTVLNEIFKFHGAEHKAVNYYESDYKGSLESHSRLAKRCGTNLVVFYFIIITITGYLDVQINFYLEALLALGLAYELILYSPKLLLLIPFLGQRYTTVEPEKRHIKAAQKALDILIWKENEGKIN